MCEKLNEAVSLVPVKKCVDDRFLLTEEEYNKKIEPIRQLEEILKCNGSKKTNTYYRMVCKYGTLVVNGRDKLIKPHQDEG